MPTHAKIDITKALELKSKGVLQRDIAKFFECSPAAVSQALAKYLPEDIDLKTYNNHRADIWKGKEAQLLLSVKKEDIEKMPPASRIIAAGICYDKTRLEEGKSTENVADFHAQLASLNKAMRTLEEIKKLRKQLESSEDENITRPE